MEWQQLDLDGDPDEIRFAGNPADLVDALAGLLEAVERRPAWHAHAVCRGQGPDKWFPGRGESAATAIAACDGCPVRRECRDFALADPTIDGIWAGTAKATRRAMRKRAA